MDRLRFASEGALAEVADMYGPAAFRKWGRAGGSRWYVSGLL